LREAPAACALTRAPIGLNQDLSRDAQFLVQCAYVFQRQATLAAQDVVDSLARSERNAGGESGDTRRISNTLLHYYRELT
jgi:hypothetical protein